MRVDDVERFVARHLRSQGGVALDLAEEVAGVVLARDTAGVADEAGGGGIRAGGFAHG
jgi:hypothetical protein